MTGYNIEESLINSIGRDKNGEPINEILFQVVSWQGRNYLYKGVFDENNPTLNRIAECINGDYVERFGGMRGWLSSKLKQTNKRIKNLNYQIEDLCDERDDLYGLRYSLEDVVS